MAEPGSTETYENIEDTLRAARRQNLRGLIDSFGLEDVIRRTPITKSVLLQYIGLRPTRAIGTKLARKIERSFGYPAFWMDHLHPDEEEPSKLHEMLEQFRTYPIEKFPELLRRIGALRRYMELALRQSALDNSSASFQTKKPGNSKEEDRKNVRSSAGNKF